jgi:hypothetical protein
MVLVSELRIGELEGEEAYLFGRVDGLDVDSEGRIVVVDGQARNVRIFSPDGEHLSTIGRDGSGPGEFRRPDQVRVTPDGRIIVRDQPSRFSLFAPDGTFLHDWPLRSGFSTSVPFFLEDGTRVLNPNLPDRLVRYELDGTVVDTIDYPTRGYIPPRLEVTTPGGHASYSVPFTPNESWGATRAGSVLFGLTSTYRIERWDSAGKVFRIERAVDPVPVQPAEAEQARERVTRAIHSANAPSWRWNGADIPSAKPPWRSLLSGLDNSLWVVRSTTAVEEPNPAWDAQHPADGFPTRWVEPVVADVFDAEGQYLGPVKIPRELRLYPPPVVRSDRIWAAAFHESGHPQVVRYRLESLRTPEARD